MCGDFKVTGKAVCRTEQNGLPQTRDIFANLNSDEAFSSTDFEDTCNQLPLNEAAKQILIENTPKWLYCNNRLPFGVASAPAIFKRRMEEISQGLPGVQVYLDDAVVAEKSRSTVTPYAKCSGDFDVTVSSYTQKVQAQAARYRVPRAPYQCKGTVSKERRHGCCPKDVKANLRGRTAVIHRSCDVLRSILEEFVDHAGSALRPIPRSHLETDTCVVTRRWGCPLSADGRRP